MREQGSRGSPKYLDPVIETQQLVLTFVLRNRTVSCFSLPRIQNDNDLLIESIWETLGKNFTHPLEKVPASYGEISDVEFFRPQRTRNVDEVENL